MTRPEVDERADSAVAALARIWRQRRADVEEQLELLEAVAVAGLDGSLDQALGEQARRAAHRLAGSLGTFGLERGSVLARRLELAFDRRVATSSGGREVAELVAELSRAVQAFDAPVGDEDPAPPAPRRASSMLRRLHVVSMDPADAALVVDEAARRGVLATVIGDGEMPATEAAGADAVVIDLDRAERERADRIADDGDDHGPPVVALSSRRRLSDRVTAVRLGARRFLPKPASPAEILDAVEELWPIERTTATVVAVDDDPMILDLLRTVLEPTGIGLLAVDDDEAFWRAVEEHRPEVVILDVDMPVINGIELCRVLRSDDRWRQVGVVFLTARDDPATREAVFGAGADDLVVKPIVGPELVTRVRARIDRFELHRRLADTDGLTGLANRGALERQLDHLLGHAEDTRPLAFAVVDLDRFKRTNDAHGHRRGDEVLRRLADLIPTAEPTVAGRWGGEEFVLLFEATAAEEAVRRVGELLERFGDEQFGDRDRTFQSSFSAGVAVAPADATDALALYRKADAALYRAKARGRARVVSAHEIGADAAGQAIDVVVVEDDDVLAGLLLDTIARRGWSVERFADGRHAVARLSGPSADLRPRAIVLDVDLPGLDGLGVLRRLADRRVLARTKVVMLTARSREDEVLAAFRLGAHDHVAKPFSAPVLMERLRRIVEG